MEILKNIRQDLKQGIKIVIDKLYIKYLKTGGSILKCSAVYLCAVFVVVVVVVVVVLWRGRLCSIVQLLFSLFGGRDLKKNKYKPAAQQILKQGVWRKIVLDKLTNSIC